MKKIFVCILLIIGIGIILFNSGPKIDKELKEKNLEKRSIFISYIELGKYLNGKSSDVALENIKMMVNNVYNLGFNEIILQVRSFSDAIYKSDIFPWSRYISGVEGVDPGYDPLDFFIKEANKKDISVIAWINPYRVRNSEDISDISIKNPAYKYLNSDVVYINNGIFFNPSKQEVSKLILDGVLEIITNYEIDGILFDDYFYPNNEIDINDYNEYLKTNPYIEKSQYNLNVINGLIKEVKVLCKKNNILFGISPDGNMENNYNKVFADVKRWGSSLEYVDFIMPQVYYGFFNETKPFKKVIDEWESVVGDGVSLRIALAFYKVGVVDKWARSGKDEWIENNDIIMRQILFSRNLNNYQGFSFFRYDYIFNEEMYSKTTDDEIKNIKKILN